MLVQIEASNLIKKYGQKITISKSGQTIKSSAFIQPLRADEQSNLYDDYNQNKVEQYLYIGLPDCEIDDSGNTTVSFDNENYSVVKSESVWLSNRIIYNRAVMEKQQS